MGDHFLWRSLTLMALLLAVTSLVKGQHEAAQARAQGQVLARVLEDQREALVVAERHVVQANADYRELAQAVTALGARGSSNEEQPTPGVADGSALSATPSTVSDPREASEIARTVQRVAAERGLAMWQHRRRAYLESPAGFSLDVINPLRSQLGDDRYERYLRAAGRGTAVGVGDLPIESSAARLGLQSGDRITHYGGSRVFHLHELRALSVRGELGEYVAVQVLRGEQVLYLNLQRGPLLPSPTA